MRELILVAALLFTPRLARADTQLYASLLPTMRSVQVGTPATVFAAVINAGTETATAVSVAIEGFIPIPSAPVDFLYQTLDINQHLTGTPNTPVDISPGATQLFLLALTPQGNIPNNSVGPPTQVLFTFQGTNTQPAPVYRGLNTLYLVAEPLHPPDLIASPLTCPSDDGLSLTLNIPGPNGVAAFAFAITNIGGKVSFYVFGAKNCQTNSQTGVCLAPPALSTPITLAPGDSATFSVFVFGNGQEIPFDPANNRVGVSFLSLPIPHLNSFYYGETSVAVRTHSPACALS